MTMQNEQDLRLRLLNTLLTTPHRKLEEVWPVHRDMAQADPLFYVRLAAWYADHGDVRDHSEMFVVALALSEFPGHRETGLALLRRLPPYEVLRVLDFIHGRKTTRKVRRRPVIAEAAATRSKRRRGIVHRIASALTGAGEGVEATAPAAPAASVEPQLVTESFGLFRNPPRSLKTEISRYLREREADAEWFDSTVLTARKAVKRLYALNHLKPGERAQRVLFDGEAPPGSRLHALRELAKAAGPEAQARAILEHAIPYRVAATVVRQMTPSILLALIDRMSAQELINSLASLKKRGALDNPDLKAAIDAKLEAAKSGARVSAFKTGKAAEAAPLPADVKAKLEQVADTQVKAKGRIKRPTALLIDKSGSMSVAIELGKRIGAMVSAVCEAELFVYAFDTMAYPIAPAGDDLAAWERALAGIKAGGGTSCGAAVECMRIKRQYAEQIILVTDEEENTAPLLVPTLQKYRVDVKADPSVCIVRTPRGGDHLQRQCREAGIVTDVLQFDGDYYALPNLVPLLSRPSRLELLMEIMEYPLPVRKPA